MPEGLKPLDFGEGGAGEIPPKNEVPQETNEVKDFSREALDALLGAFEEIAKKNGTKEAQAAWEDFAVALKDRGFDTLDTSKIEELSEKQREGFKKLLDRRKDAAGDPEKWNTLVQETVQFIEGVGSEDSKEDKAKGDDEGIPFMITREMHQQLADLGYSEKDRSKLKPEEAHTIITERQRKWFRFGRSNDNAEEEPSKSPLESIDEHLKGREEDRGQKRAEQTAEGFLELRKAFNYAERALQTHGEGSPEDMKEVGKFQRQVRVFFNGEPDISALRNPHFAGPEGMVNSDRSWELRLAGVEHDAIQREIRANDGKTNPELEKRWSDLMSGMVYTFRMMELDERPAESPPSGPERGEINPSKSAEDEGSPEDAKERRERITRDSQSAIRVLRESFRRKERARKKGGAGSRKSLEAMHRFAPHIETFLSNNDLDFEQMGLNPEEVSEFEDLCSAFKASKEDIARFAIDTTEYSHARRENDKVLDRCLALLWSIEEREKEDSVESGNHEPAPPEGLPVRESPEDAPASPEAPVSPEDREKLNRGFFYWGRMIQEYRGRTMGWILTSTFSEKGRMSKAFHRIGEHYQKEAAKAHKERMSPHSERKLSKVRDAGLLMGNVLRYGSVFANFANMGNPFRLAMGTAMFAGRFGKAAKEVDLEEVGWLEKHRVGSEITMPALDAVRNASSPEDAKEKLMRSGKFTEEQADEAVAEIDEALRTESRDSLSERMSAESGLDRAMEEAHRLNHAINDRVAHDGMGVQEAYDLEYKRTVSEDVQKRFAHAEKEGRVDGFVAKIAKAEYGRRTATLDDKIFRIEQREKDGEIGRKEAKEQIQGLVSKHEEFIKEVDAMVSDMGTINTSAYIMKNMERGSKVVAFGMTAFMGYTLLGRVAEAADSFEWSSSTSSSEHDVSGHEGGADFEPTERQLRESGSPAFTPEEIRRLREMGGEEAGLAERLGHDVVAAESEESRLRAGLAAIDVEIEAHEAHEGGPPPSDLLERAREFNDRIEAASGDIVDARGAVRSVIDTGELPPGAHVSPDVAAAAESIAESHIAEEGPHAEVVYKIEEGDSPIKALKEMYKSNDMARAHLLESLDIEKLKAGDLDRIVTRKVVAEYLLEYGTQETAEHYDSEANKILEKAIDGWQAKHEGVTFDPQDQGHLQELARQLSVKDFNSVLNNKVPNLVFEGDAVVLDSNGNYEVTAPEGDEIRRGHIDTLERTGLRDLAHAEAPGEQVNVGTHRFGIVEAGAHFEMTHGIEPNPFEGHEWRTDTTELGSFQYTNVNIVFEEKMRDFGFTKALAYKSVGSREIEAIFFFRGNATEGLEIYRRGEGDILTETKSQFYKRVVKVLEDPKTIEKWGK
ncbi:MAG: hypothetical protein O2794_04255 [bacterium]|nr:hypothetical protein [bacterium]